MKTGTHQCTSRTPQQTFAQTPMRYREKPYKTQYQKQVWSHTAIVDTENPKIEMITYK